MTHASLTPERTTNERVRDLLPEDDITARTAVPQDDRAAPPADELKRAEVQRLDRMERERATDEGMVPMPADPHDV